MALNKTQANININNQYIQTVCTPSNKKCNIFDALTGKESPVVRQGHYYLTSHRTQYGSSCPISPLVSTFRVTYMIQFFARVLSVSSFRSLSEVPFDVTDIECPTMLRCQTCNEMELVQFNCRLVQGSPEQKHFQTPMSKQN